MAPADTAATASAAATPDTAWVVDLGACLRDRLREERAAARRRLRDAPGGRPDGAAPPATTLRGLRLVEELLRDLEDGAGPDPSTARTLALAHRSHPAFRAEWDRPA